MKKRLLSLLLALAMMFTLAACGGKREEPAEETQDQVEEIAPEEETGAAPEEETDVTVIDPEETDTPDQPENLPAEPTEEPKLNTKPADPAKKPESTPVQKPVENVPAEKPAEDQSKPAPGVDLTAFYESVLSASEWPMMGAMEGETLDAFYPGLTAIAVNQSVVSMAMMGSVVAEIALVEVQNAADVETVKGIFQARINYQVGDENNPGGAWYPESIEGWKNDSRIVTNGNYVMMVAYSGADDVVAAFQALVA